MVHKKFGNPASKKESKWVDRSPHPSARNYFNEMAPINGFHEENAEMLRLRDSFRDEVSKQMGELLLKGQTMLDEYCTTCSGILMEDRNGVRRCVTCELFQKKTSQIVTEIPLQEDDLKEAVDSPPTPPIEKKPSKSPNSTIPRKTEVANEQKPTTKILNRSNSIDAIDAAKYAVHKKLEWATSQLESTEEISQVVDFLSVIQKAAETIKALNF